MAVGDIYERRLRTNPELLGTGTPSSSTFLRGDGTWGSPSVDNIENTLIQMAWDVYSEDRAFDDIYADDLTDQTGIDTVNSAGTYNSGSSYYQPTVATTGSTTDYTSTQLDTTHWTDINSVAITQTTPGDVTASAIYHAISFDGGVNYKSYKYTANAGGSYPSARRLLGNGVVYNGYLYIFGGFDGTSNLNDTYRLNLTTFIWELVSTSGTPPSGRRGHTSVFYLSGTTPYMYVFGGIDASTTNLQDIHRLNLSTFAWSGTLSTSGTPPSVRRNHSAEVSGDYMYIFGGYGASPLQDTHSFNLSTLTWSGEITTSGSKPSVRYLSFTGIYNGYLYIFGGMDTSSVYNDLYRLDLSTNTWSGSLSTSGTPPSARHVGCGSYFMYNGNFYVIGGANFGASSIYYDVNRINLSSLTWSGPLSTTGDASNLPIYSAGAFSSGIYYAVCGSVGSSASQSNVFYRLNVDTLTWYGNWVIVAKNNSGTWQYNDAGTLTNASTNSLAGAMSQSTAQSAYQWTKANIEAMTDANWEESGGWSTSVNTIDWTYSLVTGLTAGYAADATATSTADLSANGTWGNANTCAATSENTAAYAAWYAFDQGAAGGGWSSTAAPSSGTPQSIGYDFGSGNAKIINKYSFQSRSDATYTVYPQAWKFQGSNDTNAAVGDAETANGWTTLAEVTGASTGSASQVQYYTSTNTTAYRKYRFRITANNGGTSVQIFEIKLLEATTSTATPTYTKTTFNHDTEYAALDLRTNGWEASANDPTDGYVVLDVEPVDSITNNTDIKAYLSIDNGSNYEQVTLESTPFREIGDHDYIRGDISGITARTDKTIRFKVTSHNSKNFKLHGLGGGVKY